MVVGGEHRQATGGLGEQQHEQAADAVAQIDRFVVEELTDERLSRFGG